MEMEQRSLVNELKQGKELAKQLRNHLNPSSSEETRQFLVEKILSSYEKALSLLNWAPLVLETQPPAVNPTLGSPQSSFANTSPRSDGSNLEWKDQCSKGAHKKRKTSPRWTEQVKVCLGVGAEDGYCWRKYGQKDILGSNFPRGYYRCTHRHTEGCLATKQVQRSDSDPTVFEVTYRGRHTCNTRPSNLTMATTNQVSKENKDNRQEQQQLLQQQELSFNFGSNFKVKTEDLDMRDEIFPSFSFHVESENVNNNDIFWESNFMESFSSTFLPPTTSESNHFSASPCHMTNYRLGQIVQSSESDLTAEIISAPTSVTNSPMEDFGLSSLDMEFPFDNVHEIFSCHGGERN